MLFEILAALTILTPSDIAKLHYDKEPAAFCDGVWTSAIARMGSDIDYTDIVELNLLDKITISCPRPYWYIKPPRKLVIPSQTTTCCSVLGGYVVR